MITPKIAANMTLGIVTVGTFASYPFVQHPVGGFLFAGFCAATVGGWADTFAIAALFGRPLNLRYPGWIRTDVIRKRRRVLTDAMTHMVQNELLTPDRITDEINKFPLTDLINSYLYDHGGKEAVIDIVQRLAADLARKIEPAEMAETLQRTLLNQAVHVQVSELLADILDWSVKNGYDDKVIDFLIEELSKLTYSREFKEVVSTVVGEVLRSYESGGWLRGALNALANLNQKTITDKIINGLNKMLSQFQNSHSSERRAAKEWLKSLAKRLRGDRQLQERVENGKLKLLSLIGERVKVADLFQPYLQAYREAAATLEWNQVSSEAGSFRWLEEVMERALDPNNHNTAQAWKKIEGWAKEKLIQSIPHWHDKIGSLVSKKLAEYQDDEIIELVKKKAGRDLHFIRLSGTIVGGVIGMILYFVLWLAG